MIETALHRAVELINNADSLLITAGAGAGLGVDAGLPDFRGPNGFWGVYPALGKARLHFEDIANPQAFVDYPRLAWGFYGHRLNLYRRTLPGATFAQLRLLADNMPKGAFALTSNVDGLFHRAGFPAQQICEIHGSIHHLQCLQGCSSHIWSADTFVPKVDETSCQLISDLPTCAHCGGLARPNILMFGDWGWIANRQQHQEAALHDWLNQQQSCITLEIGAGTAIPSVRHFGESLPWPLIRINLHEANVRRPEDVGLAMTGREALASLIDLCNTGKRKAP